MTPSVAFAGDRIPCDSITGLTALSQLIMEMPILGALFRYVIVATHVVLIILCHILVIVIFFSMFIPYSSPPYIFIVLAILYERMWEWDVHTIVTYYDCYNSSILFHDDVKLERRSFDAVPPASPLVFHVLATKTVRHFCSVCALSTDARYQRVRGFISTTSESSSTHGHTILCLTRSIVNS